MESETPQKPPNDFIKGMLAMVIGHGIVAIGAISYQLLVDKSSNSLLNIAMMTFCMAIPAAQWLYALPLIIYFVIKKRLMAMAGVLTAFGLTWLLAFGLCFAMIFLGSQF